MRNVCRPFGNALETACRSASYPYDSTRSASSMTRCVTFDISTCAERLLCTRARDGVAITMSGCSASRDLQVGEVSQPQKPNFFSWEAGGSYIWTFSDKFCAILTARMDLPQYAANRSVARCTCSASSRVGTRIRALVSFSSGELCGDSCC